MCSERVSPHSSGVQVFVQRLPHGAGLAMPGYETSGSAGVDLPAACPENEPLDLQPGHRVLVPTGFAIALPPGFEAQIRPRSGFAFKHGVTVLNTPGTIDSDYRGELKILLINHGDAIVTITRGMRIAQMVIAPVTQVRLQEVTTLDETDRGTGGFGSTGQ